MQTGTTGGARANPSHWRLTPWMLAAVWSSLAAVIGGALIGASIILSNVPGLADGLGRQSGPLAIVTVVAAAYLGIVGLASVARLRRGRSARTGVHVGDATPTPAQYP
jgi:hypothetical protein